MNILRAFCLLQEDIIQNFYFFQNFIAGCRCTGSGDVHYYDFKNTKSDIQGICKYTFSRSTEEFPYEKCKWNIEVKNERRGTKTSVSYTKMADVTICGEKIRIMKDGVFKVGIYY